MSETELSGICSDEDILRMLSEHPERSVTLRRHPLLEDSEDIAVTRWIVDNKEPEEKEALRPAAEPERNSYRLLSRISAGGMGEIWSAMQNNLQRVVAVKRLISRSTAEVQEEARLRFRQEALVAAQLNHPNIVPVHDLGIGEDGELLMAMKYVRGTRWDEIIHADSKSRSLEEVLAIHIPILLSVAQAASFAHSRGIVHRDLKASQVIVGEFGEVTLMDWGLAVCINMERLDSAPSVQGAPCLPTRRDAPSPAGTATFMAPEQLQNAADEIGYWTDVYLLGAILHRLICGRNLRHGLKGHELIDWILEGRYHSFPPDFEPAELVELAVLCLQPDPARRLPTAGDFVEKLQEYLSGTRRRQKSQALVADAKRRLEEGPLLEYHTAAELMALLNKAQSLWPNKQETIAVADRVLASFVDIAIRNNDLTLARIHFNSISDPDMRSKVGVHVEQAVKRAQRHEFVRQLALRTCFFLLTFIALIALIFNQQLTKRTNEAEEANAQTQEAIWQAVEAGNKLERQLYRSSIALSERLLNSGSPYLARAQLLNTKPEHRDIEWALLYRLASTELISHDAGIGPLRKLAVAPDATSLAVISETGAAFSFDIDGFPTGELHHGLAIDSAYSGDGSNLAILHDDGAISLSGHIETSLPSIADASLAVQWLPDNAGLVVAGDGNALICQDVNGEVLWRTEIPETIGAAIGAPSSDGLFPVGGASGDIYLISTEGLRQGNLTGHAGAILSLAFSENGRLVSSSADSTTRVWDVEHQEAVQVVHASDEVEMLGAINSAILSDSLGMLFTAGEDGRVRFWHEGSNIPMGELPRHPAAVTGLALLPDGRHIATTSRDGIIRLWDRDQSNSGNLSGHSGRTVARGHTPDGRHVVTMAHDNTARLWDTETCQTVRIFEPPMDQFNYAEGRLSHDGTRLAVGTRANIIRLYDTHTGDVLHSFAAEHDVDDVALSPDMTKIASGSHFGSVLIYDTKTESTTTVSGLPQETIMTLEFTPDSATLVACPQDGTIRLIDVELAAVRDNITAHPASWVERCAFNKKGTLLATAGFDGNLRLWDFRTHENIGEFRGHKSWVSDVCFSNSEQRLLTSSADGTIRVWSIENETELLRISATGGRVDSLILGPEDQWLLATYSSKDPEVWHLPAVEKGDSLRRMADWEKKRLASVQFNQDKLGAPSIKPVPPVADIAMENLADIQPPLLHYEASASDINQGRPLRVIVLFRKPSMDQKSLFIVGNRPELGLWTPNIVPLEHLKNIKEGSLWQYAVPFRPMEFKLTYGERKEEWGETGEWSGPPNREIGFRNPILIDRNGTLLVFVEFGVKP